MSSSYSAQLPAASCRARNSLIELLAAYDVTSKGHLDRDDLARLCGELEIDRSHQLEVDVLFQSLDSNGDGYVDVDDLVNAYGKVGFQVNSPSLEEPDSDHEELRPAWEALLSTLDQRSCLQCHEQLFKFWCRLNSVAPTLTDSFEEVLQLLVSEITTRDTAQLTANETLHRISSQHETHVRALEVEIEDQLRHVDSQVRQEEQEKAEKARRELKKWLSMRETEIDHLQGKLQEMTMQLQEVTQQNTYHKHALGKLKETEASLKDQVRETQQKFFLSQVQKHNLESRLSKEMTNQLEIEAEVIHLQEQIHNLHRSNQELLDASNAIQKRHWQCDDHQTSYSKDEFEKIITEDLFSAVAAAAKGRTFAEELLEDCGHSLNTLTFNKSELLSNVPFSPCEYCTKRKTVTSHSDSGISQDARELMSQEDTDKGQLRKEMAPGGHIPIVINVCEDCQDGYIRGCPPCEDRRSPEGVTVPCPQHNSAGTSAGTNNPRSDLPISPISDRHHQYSSMPTTHTSNSLTSHKDVNKYSKRSGSSELSSSLRRQQGVGGNEATKRESLSQQVQSEPLPSRQELIYKIVLVGDHGVGKTSFLQRICYDTFISTTNSSRGIDFELKKLEVSNKLVTVQLWDTAGQERYRSLAVSYFRKADGILLLYDTMKQRTLASVVKWMNDVKAYCSESVAVMIIGNKVDLVGNGHSKRIAKRQDGEKLALYGALFDETSCASGQNVESAFSELVKLVVHREECDTNWKRLYYSLSDGSEVNEIEDSIRLPGSGQSFKDYEAVETAPGCCT